YLDVEIPEDEVVFEYEKNNVCITINVRPGRLYRVGKVSLSGNTLYPESKLRKLVKICEADVFYAEKIEETEDDLRDAYGEVGYLDTYVVTEKTPNLDTGCIDLEFKIKESDRYCVETIKIKGNIKTQ